MGSSLSWFAVKGKSSDAVLRDLGLRHTGAQTECLKVRDSAASLPGGWYLVCRKRHHFSDSTLKRLSSGAEVVACSVAQIVMVSQASGWKEGRELWSILHDAQKNLRHLEARGQLPPEYAAIRDRHLAAQAGETEDVDHIFEIPAETAASLTGFEYDGAPDDDWTFETLEKVSLFQKMFGR